MGYVKMNIYENSPNINTGMIMLLPADNVIRVYTGGDDDIVVDYASGYSVSIDWNDNGFNESDVVRLKEAINIAGGNSRSYFGGIFFNYYIILYYENKRNKRNS